MSRNFDLWQRASEPVNLPEPVTIEPPAPARPERPKMPPRPQLPEEPHDWLRAISVLRKRARLVLLFASVVVASVVVATLLMRPVYEPQARVEVDPPGAEIFSLQGGGGGSDAPDYVQTQAQNLQSDGLALEVIRKLHLDRNPDFGGKAAATATASGAEAAVPNAVQLTPAENHALHVFKENRKVVRDAASRLITVSVSAHNPVLAAQITNTLVNQFIQRDFKTRNDAITESTHWLQLQLKDIRKRMDASNQALARWQKATGIGAIGDNENSFSERMIELSRQLMQARADRIQLQAYLDKMNSVQSVSLPQVSSNPVVQALTTKLAESRAQLAETLAVYGENHPRSKRLENQINELQQQLNAQRAAILSDLRTSYSAARARENLMQSQMAGANKKMAELAKYDELKKEADANTTLYTALYQKIKEAAITAATKSSNIRVVDRARVLSHPTRPVLVKNAAFGLLIGLLGGVFLAFLIESMDTRIHTPEDLRRCLGAESISVIPVIGRSEGYVLGKRNLRLPSRSSKPPSPTFLLDRPNSPESEAMRGIYTAVRLSWQNAGAARALMVASALQGEGKTVVSINLAMALAQHGPTCLVDADLRKRGVGMLLGVANMRGLAEVLQGSANLESVIQGHAQIPGLSLLTAGRAASDPGTLIASNAMPQLVAKLRERYEYVVIDSPPILPVADARSLSALVDGILMVGRSGVSTRSSMKRAMELLHEVRSAPVLEFVLNAVEYPSEQYGYYNYEYGSTA